jgi:hypothetical protein
VLYFFVGSGLVAWVRCSWSGVPRDWLGLGIGVIKLLSRCCVFCFLCYRLVIDQSKRLASFVRRNPNVC